MKNITVALGIEKRILEQFERDMFEIQDNLAPFFTKSVKEIIANHSSNLEYDQELKWCQGEQENCTVYLIYAFNLVYFPCEAFRYGYEINGFGTFLAYFSQYLGRKANHVSDSGLLNSDPLDSDGKSVKDFMAKVLQNTNKNLKLYNMTPYDLVQMLQDTKKVLNTATFAKPIQYDFGCNNYHDNEAVNQFKNAWQDWTNNESQEIPCSNKSVKYYSCCKLSQILQPDLIPIALQVMKYAIQPVAYLDYDIQPIFKNLSFLMYDNIAEDFPDKLIRNRNSRIPLCKYAGNPRVFDERKCKLFYNSLTDEGIGYTFNNVNFWNFFKKYNYSETFAEIMQPKGYTTAELDQNQLYDGVSIPMSNGPAYGMEAVIESHHAYDERRINRENSLKIAIHDPASLAMLSTSSVEVKQGHVTHFLITPRKIEASDDLREIEFEKRKCRFHDEVTDSKLFSVYTQNNCRYECKMRQAVAKCQCIPWDYPQFKGEQHPICNKYARDCFQQVMINAGTQKDCPCPNDCSVTIYDYSVSSTDFGPLCDRDGQISKYLYYEYRKGFILTFEDIYFWNDDAQIRTRDPWTWKCEDNVKKIAVVKFQIANQLVTKVTLAPRLTFADILSNIGMKSNSYFFHSSTYLFFRRNTWIVWWHQHFEHV